MQRKYYKFDDMAHMMPNAGVPMHQCQADTRGKGAACKDEVITPQPLKCSEPKKEHRRSAPYSSIFKNGRILGRYEADDIILLGIIFLLLQNKDDLDLPLLLALGYIFLSDKNFTLF